MEILAIFICILTILFGALHRLVDGRDWKPKNWNVALFLGLATICYHYFGATWTSFSVVAITAINILSGYKSFTYPWVVYIFKRLDLWHSKRLAMSERWKRELAIESKNSNESYEKNNGFHTWHTSYRFLVPSMIICSITSWNFYWLSAVIVSGLLFPISVMALEYVPQDKRDFYGELFAHTRETILGAVIIGGLPWLI